MDKVTLLKRVIIDTFSTLLAKSQKGYPVENYSVIKECMYAINLIDNTTVEPNLQASIIDYYLHILNLL